MRLVTLFLYARRPVKARYVHFDDVCNKIKDNLFLINHAGKLSLKRLVVFVLGKNNVKKKLSICLKQSQGKIEIRHSQLKNREAPQCQLFYSHYTAPKSGVYSDILYHDLHEIN